MSGTSKVSLKLSCSRGSPYTSCASNVKSWLCQEVITATYARGASSAMTTTAPGSTVVLVLVTIPGSSSLSPSKSSTSSPYSPKSSHSMFHTSRRKATTRCLIHSSLAQLWQTRAQIRVIANTSLTGVTLAFPSTTIF